MTGFPRRRAFVERNEDGYRAEVRDIGRVCMGRCVDVVTGPLLADVLDELQRRWPGVNILVLNDEDNRVARELFTGIPE